MSEREPSAGGGTADANRRGAVVGATAPSRSESAAANAASMAWMDAAGYLFGPLPPLAPEEVERRIAERRKAYVDGKLTLASFEREVEAILRREVGGAA